MRDDLQYDLCLGCAEKAPKGLFPTIMHSCPLNTVEYKVRPFKMRMFKSIFTGKDDLQSFKDLLQFDTFKAMPNYQTASDLEKKIFSHERELDIKTMKRLRAYIKLEEDFNYKY